MLCKTHHHDWQGPGPPPGQGEREEVGRRRGEGSEEESGEERREGDKLGQEKAVERRKGGNHCKLKVLCVCHLSVMMTRPGCPIRVMTHCPCSAHSNSLTSTSSGLPRSSRKAKFPPGSSSCYRMCRT